MGGRCNHRRHANHRCASERRCNNARVALRGRLDRFATRASETRPCSARGTPRRGCRAAVRAARGAERGMARARCSDVPGAIRRAQALAGHPTREQSAAVSERHPVIATVARAAGYSPYLGPVVDSGEPCSFRRSGLWEVG